MLCTLAILFLSAITLTLVVNQIRIDKYVNYILKKLENAHEQESKKAESEEREAEKEG